MNANFGWVLITSVWHKLLKIKLLEKLWVLNFKQILSRVYENLNIICRFIGNFEGTFGKIKEILLKIFIILRNFWGEIYKNLKKNF